MANRLFEKIEFKTRFSTFFHSTKYIVISLVVISGLLGYNLSKVGGKEEPHKRDFRDPDGLPALNFDPLESAHVPSGGQAIPIPFFSNHRCGSRLYYLSAPLHTYNPDVPYNISFAQSEPPISVWQDINGDNLPDYLYAKNDYTSGGAPNAVALNYTACVWLNNGSGWTKAYECLAQTRIDQNTGEILQGDYWGDCAAAQN